jgi:hypothetical protein
LHSRALFERCITDVSGYWRPKIASQRELYGGANGGMSEGEWQRLPGGDTKWKDDIQRDIRGSYRH